MKHKKILLFIAISLMVIYISNLFLDIMDIDAAQLASISLQMFKTGSYLQVFFHTEDYLDKPPLLFWLAALSFKIFNVHNFSYKLPALCAIILGIYSVYKFSSKQYNKETGVFASFILASTQAVFLMTNDVRSDGILMGFTFFGIYMYSEYLYNFKLKYLILSALGISLGMMSKGPIALFLFIVSFGTHFLITKKWKEIFNPKWILFIIIILIFLLPMLWGLYQQFDLHPEKIVYDLKGPSGIKFFFWTQSFGRITGDIGWNNGASFFFFFHSILWDMQPWALFFIPALLLKIYSTIKYIFNKNTNTKFNEFITIGGFLIGFLALSKSHYKLPHYIFCLFPFAAIITADFIVNIISEKIKWHILLEKSNFILMHLFFIAPIVAFLLFFTPNFIFPIIVISGYIVLILIRNKIKIIKFKILFTTLISSCVFGIILSAYFYPNILKYQSGSQIVHYLKQKNIQSSEVKYCETSLYFSTYFYNNAKKFDYINKENIDTLKNGTFIFTNEKLKDSLLLNNNKFSVIQEFNEFHITELNINFLLKSKRNQNIAKLYLIKKN